MNRRSRTVTNRLLLGAALATTGFGLVLRRRASRQPVLPATASDPPDGDAWVGITAVGVSMDEATRRSAVEYAVANDLDVVDLVPGDLPVRRRLDTLALVDPAPAASRPLAIGRGAYQAILARRSLVVRAGLDVDRKRGPEEMVRDTAELKASAPYTMGTAVAPTLRSSPETRRSSRELQAVRGEATPIVLALRAAGFALLAVAVARRPRHALPAAVAYCAVPLLAFAGVRGGPRGRDLVRAAVLRLPAELAATVTTIRGPWWPPGEQSPYEVRRPHYQADFANGTERFFEARRESCPWCGASDLEEFLVSDDLVQRKPGRFTLDRCAACGHVFQNPRLGPTGLEVYYRDFYDGLGQQRMETTFTLAAKTYERRARMLEGHDVPKRWLDVGTGHGHFCLAAAEVWPDTEFDGVDSGRGVDAAARRGWVRSGYRGEFLAVAAELDGTYDVVSMHQYLEHTKDPQAELDAAAALVAPGGHLLIEVPNPECRWGAILGTRWVMWFQPQHLHLVPRGNLEAALGARGFEIVDRHSHTAHAPAEFLVAGLNLIDGFAPDPRLPWREGASRSAYVRRALAVLLAGPLAVLGGALDQVLALLLRGDDWANAYRVLARREHHPSAIGGAPTPPR